MTIDVWGAELKVLRHRGKKSDMLSEFPALLEILILSQVFLNLPLGANRQVGLKSGWVLGRPQKVDFYKHVGGCLTLDSFPCRPSRTIVSGFPTVQWWEGGTRGLNTSKWMYQKLLSWGCTLRLHWWNYHSGAFLTPSIIVLGVKELLFCVSFSKCREVCRHPFSSAWEILLTFSIKILFYLYFFLQCSFGITLH